MINHSDFKIDFIGIGAPKCGTTWLAKCLKEHPDIDFSNNKETRYFLMSPEDARENLVMRQQYNCAKVKNFNDYIAEFNHDSGKIKGEFTTIYLYDPLTPYKIKELFPNVKLLVSLRAPADMLYSFFWYCRSTINKFQTPETFEDFIKDENIAKWGYYYQYLSKYYELFNQNQIHVILYDDIKANSNLVLKNLFEFLNVNKDFQPNSMNIKVWKTNQFRYNFIPKLHFLISKIIAKNPRMLKLTNRLLERNNFIKSIRKIYTKIFHKPFDYPPMNNETRKFLNNKFREDILKLSQLIGKDLSMWTKNQ